MKKITLAIVGVVCAVTSAISQPTINISAPPFNTTTGYRMPNGTFEHKFLRGVCLIKKTELTSLTASIVTNMTTLRASGTTPVAAAGTFSLWLENTADVTYNKGTAFNTAISTMALHYQGNMNIPLSTSSQSQQIQNFLMTPTFTYGGDAIYVAWAYDESTPASNTNTLQAIWAANNAGTGNGLCATMFSSVAPAPNTMTISDFRPSFTFSAVNTATLELSMIDMNTFGSVSKLAPSHSVTCVVRNNGITPITGHSVALQVSGANVFTDTQPIPTINAGATQTITFNAFSPSTTGLNNMVVAVLAVDQNTANNGLAWTQSVTCDLVSYMPMASSPTVFAQDGIGSGQTRIFSFKYTPSADAELTAVQAIVPAISAASNLGKQIYPVVMDASGAILMTGGTVALSATDMDIYKNFDFLPGQIPQLVNGTTYYIGIGMVAANHFPVGIYDPGYFIPNFYSSPSAGGVAPTSIDFGYLALGAVITNTSLAITASTTRTFVCVKETNTISVSGPTGTTYKWGNTVPTASNTAATVIISPTLSTAQNSTTVTYVVSGVSGGCKTNTTSVVVRVSKCTGIGELENAEEIGVYPNPTAKVTTVTGLTVNNTITVFNMIGQIITAQKATSDTATIDLTEQPAGTYLVRITDQTNGVKFLKVIKQD